MALRSPVRSFPLAGGPAGTAGCRRHKMPHTQLTTRLESSDAECGASCRFATQPYRLGHPPEWAGPVSSPGSRGSAPAGERVAAIVAVSSRRGSAGASPSRTNTPSVFRQTLKFSRFQSRWMAQPPQPGAGRGGPRDQCGRWVAVMCPESLPVTTVETGEPPATALALGLTLSRCGPIIGACRTS